MDVFATTDRWCVLVSTQFPPRLLLTGAVVTALTASIGTILTFPGPVPTGPVVPHLNPSPNPAVPAPVPSTPAQADGAQIAGLASPPAVPPPAAAHPRSQRTHPEPAAQRRAATAGDGLSEADWARLPPRLRQQVRLACHQGWLTGPHCAHA